MSPLLLQQLTPLGPKTTMRIGGLAKFYAEITSKKEAEEAVVFAKEHKLPLIILGAGSNTIFADGMIEALVIRILADNAVFDGKDVRAEAGMPLASLLMECAGRDLDLSPLTGIPGTVGGAVFGNAGQGHGGIWIDSFIDEVEVYFDGQWKVLSGDKLKSGYRSSSIKEMADENHRSGRAPRVTLSEVEGRPRSEDCEDLSAAPIIWSARLRVPTRPKAEVLAEIERLLKRRIETQPHRKTAGSCFVSLPDGTPAWKLIEEAGLRGGQVGDIRVSEKHANFLENATKGIARFDDAIGLIRKVKDAVDRRNGTDLRVEMQCYDDTGNLVF